MEKGFELLDFNFSCFGRYKQGGKAALKTKRISVKFKRDPGGKASAGPT